MTNGDVANDILITLRPDATLEDDYSLDAIKRSGNEFISLYSFIEDEHYAIQSIPNVIGENINIQLGFNIVEPGTYTLDVEDFEGIPEGIWVRLIDHETYEVYELSEGASISFDIHDRGVKDNKFTLTFGRGEQTILGVDEQFSLKAYGSSEYLNIEKLGENNLTPVSIVSLDGKVIMEKQVEFFNGKAGINAPNLKPHQIYILKIAEERLKFIVE